MSTTLTTNEFLDYLRRSKLAETSVLEKALDVIQKQFTPEQFFDSDVVSQELVRQGLITPWHVRQLMKKKYKGFYLRQYRILGHLGTGGMSTVYLAEHTVMQRLVAIKVLPRNKLVNPAYLDRFVQESRAIASLDHPHIVRAYDIDQLDDIHYIVMEYFEGVNLRQRVEKEGPLPFEDAVHLMRNAAIGLVHAHRIGVIHRDIKPENLLVDERGTLKILDLGLALLSDSFHSESSIPSERKIVGTADYLAPEQVSDSQKIDARADIYSLGGTLYFCLTGHPPFPHGTIAQRLLSHQTKSPRSIFDARPEAPLDLVRICDKMMAKKPEDRFKSAEELVTTFERWLIHHGAAQPRDFPDTAESELITNDSLLGEVQEHFDEENIFTTESGDPFFSLNENEEEDNFVLTSASNDGFVNLLGSGGSSVFGEHSPIVREMTTSKIQAKQSSERTNNVSSGKPQISGSQQKEAALSQKKKTSLTSEWYREIPFWFWAVFVAGYLLAVFLAGILLALITH